MSTSTRPAPASERGATMFGSDFDELAVGDSYEGAPCRISSRDVAVFAALTGDRHPIHVDPEWAATGPFGGLIAHGLLVLSCAAGSLPFDPERILALRRISDAVFKRPLEVGDSISVRSTVSDLRPLDEGTGLVGCEWRISGADRRLRARARAEILWRRGNDGAERPSAWKAALVGRPGAEGLDPELAPVAACDDGMRVLI